MPTDILRLTAPEILKRYDKKRLSPVEVVRACIAQVRKHNPACNAITVMDEKRALCRAKASEKRWMDGASRGALDGIPVTVKDSFDVKGWPSRQGSKTTSSLPQRDDAPAVSLLRDANAIILAKTTMPEFGVKGVTDSPLTGVTRNPWNAGKTPGGSSGGAAVAAATGMGFMNLGSDAGGSVRIPASFTGVVGFKPSPGLVPALPAGLFSTLWAAGPLTRTVADAALCLDTVARHDARDWHSLPLPPFEFSKQIKKPLPKLRIAVASSINGIEATPEVRAVFDKKVKLLKKIGHVEEIELDIIDMIETFNRLWAAVAGYIVWEFPDKTRRQLDKRFLSWAEKGEALPLDEYLWAERERMTIGEYFKGILTTYDLLVTPATPMAAFEVGRDMPDDASGKPWFDWTPFTYPANLARLPSASLPMGMTESGLPAGMLVTAGYLRDGFLMQACAKIEELLEFTPWLEAREKAG